MLHTSRTPFRVLCWLLTVLLLASPQLQVFAQQAASPVQQGNEFVLPQACAVISVNPQAILNSPACQMLPLEVVQAASIQKLGIDALKIERIVASMETPQGGPPNYAVVGKYFQSIPDKLHPQITSSLELQAGSERPLYRNAQPFAPSLFFPTDEIVVAAPEGTIEQLRQGGAPGVASALLQSLAAAANDDLFVSVDFVPLRPLVNMALMQKGLPTELSDFYLAPNLIKTITLRVNISHAGTTELFVEANNSEDVDSLVEIVQKAADMIDAEISKETDRLLEDPDPVQQALGRYQQRMMNGMKQQFVPQKDGAQLVILRQNLSESNDRLLGLSGVAVSGILVALILPAIQAAREAARRAASINNLRQIVLAFHNYHDAKGHFPPYASFDANGKPLLSWRVHILPFLEQQALYAQFHLDEPWDSEHNKTLISQMPALFLDPSSQSTPASGKAYYLGVKGQDMVFTGTAEGVKLRAITDGTSNTLALLQVGDSGAVEWTKPADWEWNEKQPLAGLLPPLHPGIFNAAYADGSVRAISVAIDPAALKAMLTIAEADPVP